MIHIQEDGSLKEYVSTENSIGFSNPCTFRLYYCEKCKSTFNALDPFRHNCSIPALDCLEQKERFGA
jgi:hypothetical protein